MSNLAILHSYAAKDPATLPASVLFNYSSTSLTIYDVFPKSIFHFLLLPRIQAPLTAADLNSLSTLLRGDKARAKEVISALNEDAKSTRKEIEGEMMKRYGFKWEVWAGFHSAPSME